MTWRRTLIGGFELEETGKGIWEGWDILIRASRLNKVMADKGKKSSMKTFAPNDKADYYSWITSITVNGKNAYELKGKFLDDLHNNAFSGTNGKDAVEHIEYYLNIIDPIKLPNIDHDLHMYMLGGGWKWQDLQGLLWWIIIEVCLQQNES
ncbi:hypothetical protein Tco_1385790 [Tanacetum coccineum]